MNARTALTLLFAALLAACTPSAPIVSPPIVDERAVGIAAFETVRQVLQHPRCQNCHIPGDAPLQFDAGLPHQMAVMRGPDGMGSIGLPCATCHGEENPPASFGPHAPPGAPNWFLPPPQHKMVFINVSPARLCATVKDTHENGGKNFDALIKHVAEDKLVLWGWNPGGERAPVSVPHDEFVAKFKQWAAAGGPCPSDQLAAIR
jgi:mono/diheme cytochrome c family protein